MEALQIRRFLAAPKSFAATTRADHLTSALCAALRKVLR
jgi:hypothetical protein